jgi:hypothetical protein
MPNEEFVGAEEPVTDSDLNSLEVNYGFRFPSAVRNHYLLSWSSDPLYARIGRTALTVGVEFGSG